MAGLFSLFTPPWEKYHNPALTEYDDPIALVAAASADAAKQKGGMTYIGGITHSMHPTMEIGDCVIYVQKKDSEWKEGDIVMYKAPSYVKTTRPDAPVAHRLVMKDKAGWIASGDNTPRSESQGRITKDNYLGTIVSIHRPKKKPPSKVK